MTNHTAQENQTRKRVSIANNDMTKIRDIAAACHVGEGLVMSVALQLGLQADPETFALNMAERFSLTDFQNGVNSVLNGE